MSRKTLLLVLVLVVILALLPLGQDLGDVVETALPTSDGVLGTPVSTTPTPATIQTNTSSPTLPPTETDTPSPTPTNTLTPTPIPPEIFMTLEKAEIFLEIEKTLAQEFASYNEENSTSLEFESIIFNIEDLESGVVVIELLDMAGNVIGYIPEDKNWCILDCKTAGSIMIEDVAFANFSPEFNMTKEEFFEMIVSSPIAQLGGLRGLVYYDALSTQCYLWSIIPHGVDFKTQKRALLVDEVFSMSLMNLGIEQVYVTFSGCDAN
jgi:hypothetical protein